jgi:hypothetical protein
MKKQLVIIGILTLLICVGLSGCTSIGLTDIGDIQANPEKYLNKEVTVEGTCSGLFLIADTNGHYIMYQYSTIITGKYRLTGMYTKNSILGYFLNVTKAESI